MVEQVLAIKRLLAPAQGDWVSILKAFARIKPAPESNPFAAEIKNLKLDKYQKTLKEFVDIRNALPLELGRRHTRRKTPVPSRRFRGHRGRKEV